MRRGREIRRAVREGERIRSRAVDLYLAPSPAGRPRFAVVVPRYGRGAVRRNRLRRRIREFLRREWLPAAREAAAAVDLVARARPAGYEVSPGRLTRSLSEALEEAGCSAD